MIELEVEQMYISLFLNVFVVIPISANKREKSLQISAFLHHCLFLVVCKILRSQCSLVFALVTHHSTTGGIDWRRAGFSVDSILTNIIYSSRTVWAHIGEEYLGCQWKSCSVLHPASFFSLFSFFFFSLLLTNSKRKTRPSRRQNHYTGANTVISTNAKENGEQVGVFSRICRNDGHWQLSWFDDVYKRQYKRISDELREVW